MLFLFFVFKQKTAYEMRISDWSSDVCSSDLPMPFPGLNIDNLPFFAVIAACASGSTMIHDWVYDNRAIYLTDLNRLGANVRLLDPHRLDITDRKSVV